MPVNIIVVGIGHSHADGVVGELKQRPDLFNIIGYVENDDSIVTAKQNTNTYSNLTRLTETNVLNGTYDVDGIVIEEEMEKIIPACIKYLTLGVPIHADKPTGLNNDFLTYIDMAKAANIPVQIGYMYRYSPQILELKKKINQGAIGKISQFDVEMDIDLSVQNRKKLIEPYTGGSMYVYGSHILDIVTSIMGFPKTAYSFLGRSGFDNLNIVDNAIALLKYDNCCATIKTNVVSANGYLHRHVVVSGISGAISIEPLESPICMKYTARKAGGNGGDGAVDLSTVVDLSSYNFSRRYQFMMQNFFYMITGQTNNMYVKCDYEYEKELHKLLLKIIGAETLYQ